MTHFSLIYPSSAKLSFPKPFPKLVTIPARGGQVRKIITRIGKWYNKSDG